MSAVSQPFFFSLARPLLGFLLTITRKTNWLRSCSSWMPRVLAIGESLTQASNSPSKSICRTYYSPIVVSSFAFADGAVKTNTLTQQESNSKTRWTLPGICNRCASLMPLSLPYFQLRKSLSYALNKVSKLPLWQQTQLHQQIINNQPDNNNNPSSPPVSQINLTTDPMYTGDQNFYPQRLRKINQVMSLKENICPIEMSNE